VVWLPSTAAGEVGEAEAGATMELGFAPGWVGPDCAGEGDDDADADAVADDDVLCVAAGVLCVAAGVLCVAAGALCVAVGTGLAVLGDELG
jgi:hypothetical protein